jgi:MioC protein
MSGTAELVAEEVSALLEDAGYASKIQLMDRMKVEDLTPGVYVICTSTYGTGEVPDNGKPLYAALETGKPDLRGIVYGVIGLGDSIYPGTFCFGGKRFDELFTSLGASRVGERLDHDRRCGGYPEDTAREWILEWLPLLAQRTSSDQTS